MDTAVVLALVALTSAGAVWIARLRRAVSAAGLRAALSAAMRLVGWIVVFLAVNVSLGVATVLVARAVGRGFVSAYLLDDVSLVALSALQGLVVGSYGLAGTSGDGRARG